MQDDSASATGLKILLVDDEVLVRAGTAMMLDELGHAVVEASSGKQGLQLLAEDSSINLLITDFNMPDMDGLELIDLAKQNQPAMSFILMTGYSSGDERFDGADIPRLEKPFGLDALEAALGELR